ncbi:MAG: TonB C-terminal domain-containing protein [Gemmatimonadota bacterium]|nr:TonB C-terminal domain-containing protein [Gemmatimonadota bacterium]
MSHRSARPDGVATVGTLLVHAGMVVLALWSSVAPRPPLDFVTYEIEIVSPAPPAQGEEEASAREEFAVERPDAEPPREEVAEPERAQVTETQPPSPQEEVRPPPPEPAEESRPATTTDPVPEKPAEESGEGINVRMEGLRRDYPEYYNNVTRQIQRCFRWRQEGSWETTVYFVINRDGSVVDLDFVKRSGNSAFDFEAMAAVECAGQGRLGPLPDELPWDRLPIQFNFRPSGGIRG